MRDVGFRQFDVTELGPDKGLRSVDARPFYLPISSIEPLGPRSARFLGYDADSNPLLGPAIRQAVESGGVTASLPTELLQHGRGVLLFKAVYQGRYTPWTSDARRALLHGMIALELPGSSLIDDLVEVNEDLELSLTHRDFQAEDSRGSLYRHVQPAILASRLPWWPRFTYRRIVDIYGQPFTLAIGHWAGKEVIQGWDVMLALLTPLVFVTVVASAMRNRRIAHLEAQRAH